MRRALLGLLLAAFCSAPAAAEEPSVAQVWSGDRADTLPQHRWEVGVFAPLRYGLTDRVELSTHPLAFFVLPNLSAKISWNDDRPWRLSTRHGLHYPTLALNLVSREGSGGVLPATTDVPQIFATSHEVLATTNVPLWRRWFTIRLGFSIAARFGGERLPAIELPVLFPRTAAYSSFGVGHAGITLEGELVGPLYYLLDVTMFATPGFKGTFTFENTAQLSWRPSTKFMLLGGARAIYAGYPYGERLHVLPMLDAKFAF